MKIAILAIAAIFATGTSAFAADMPVKSRPVVAPAYNWTGGYIGASVGYGWDSNSSSYTCGDFVSGGAIFTGCGSAVLLFGGTVPSPLSYNGKGGLAGLQAGYNYQFGAGLVGVEFDYSWSRIKGDGTTNFSFVPNALGAGSTANIVSAQKLDSFATIRGRLGWLPSQHWLIYVTGGLAFGHVNRNVALNSPTTVGILGGGFAVQCFAGQPCYVGAAKQSSVGWTVGGGTEWAISTNFSVKAEYLYARLAGETITANGVALPVVAAPGTIRSTFQTSYDHIDLHVARIGLNYHFNAPVVAKY